MSPSMKKVVLVGLNGQIKTTHELTEYVEKTARGGGKLVQAETRLSQDYDRALLTFEKYEDAKSFQASSHRFHGNDLKVMAWDKNWDDSKTKSQTKSKVKKTGKGSVSTKKSDLPHLKNQSKVTKEVERHASKHIENRPSEDYPLSYICSTKTRAPAKVKQTKLTSNAQIRPTNKNGRAQIAPRLVTNQTYNAKHGQKIQVMQADITKLNVEAIVNAANEELNHVGGVAQAISKSAGPKLQEECKCHIATEGPLPVNHVAVTKGYKLPSKYVIHVVGPIWKRGNIQDCEQALYHSLKNCLDQAAILEVSSIAVPPVSAGVFGGPCDLVSEVMCRAVVDFCVMKTTVTDIYLVDINNEIPYEITRVLQNYPDITEQSNATTWYDGNDSTSTPTGARKNVPSKQVPFEDDRNVHGDEINDGKLYYRPTTKSTGEACAICMDDIVDAVYLDCSHVFCKSCIDTWLKDKPACPCCGQVFGALKGNQPHGQMKATTLKSSLPGFERYHTLEITYSFMDGTQKKNHPKPGFPYWGTARIAYLPDSPEGRECLRLLREAFDAGLLFTIGRSLTTGRDSQVTWNDVHHKTSLDGGPASFGYPDPTYLSRLREELAAKGIK